MLLQVVLNVACSEAVSWYEGEDTCRVLTSTSGGTCGCRKWVLTPDAQLITALGGTEDVDPDEHIRAFKHTHTGENPAIALLVLYQEAPLMTIGWGGCGGGGGLSLHGRGVSFICNTFEKGIEA